MIQATRYCDPSTSRTSTSQPAGQVSPTAIGNPPDMVSNRRFRPRPYRHLWVLVRGQSAVAAAGSRNSVGVFADVAGVLDDGDGHLVHVDSLIIDADF